MDKLECRPKNTPIVFYGPQENKKLERVRGIFTNRDIQIKQKSKNNEVILEGDFNAKLQVNKDGQEQSQSRNGKVLQGMIDNTLLVPASTDATYGFYTRVDRGDKNLKKSMIDHILMTTPMATNIINLIIDGGQHR